MNLPTGIFVKVPSTEFENWSKEDLVNEIVKLRKRIKDLETTTEKHTDPVSIKRVDLLRAHFC
jgi:hypothetical protein